MVRLALLSVPLMLAVPAGSDFPPERVTTDTAHYCFQLAQQVDAVRDRPEAVRALSAEGQRLCAAGEVLGGLRRLRRAMAVLRGDVPGP